MFRSRWLKKKWENVSLELSLKDQVDFLRDSFSLYSASPWRYIALYMTCALVSGVLISGSSILIGVLIAILTAAVLFIHVTNYIRMQEDYKRKYFRRVQ